MKLVLAIVLFTCNISFVHPSCPENTAAVFCNGAAFAPQVYCNDANPNDWPCTKKHNVWCGCSDGFARAKDNTCVRIETCRIRNDVRLLYSLASKHESEGHQKGKNLQGTNSALNELGKRVFEFIEGTEDIYLTRISTEGERNDECVCLKSTFYVKFLEEVERTLRCYFYASSAAAHESKANVPVGEKLITGTEYAAFKVSINSSQTVISVDYAPLPSDVTHLNEKELYLRGQFNVLEADLHCLLIELSKEKDGKSICALWTSVSTVNNTQSKCLDALQKYCTTNMMVLTQNIQECKSHDVSEKRADNKENEELLDSESVQ